MALTARKRPKTVNVAKTALDQVTNHLQDLPEKVKENLSLREAVDQLYEQIRSALAKGYSYEEIAALLGDTGIDISTSTLKRYISTSKGRSAKAASSTKGRASKKASAATSAKKLTSPTEVSMGKPSAQSTSKATQTATPAKRGRAGVARAAKTSPTGRSQSSRTTAAKTKKR